MPSPVAHVLHPDRLRELVDGKTFSRGEQYFEDGKVHDLRREDHAVTATVSGTTDYGVKLWSKAGRIAYTCACPVGREGNFCKHCVALALAVLERTPSPAPVAVAPARAQPQPEDEPLPEDEPRPEDEPQQAEDTAAEDLAAFDEAAVIPLHVDGGPDDALKLMVLGLYARSGKLVVCCSQPEANDAVDMICRRFGVHQTRDAKELATAVTARLASIASRD
jgi:hypothetical protein